MIKKLFGDVVRSNFEGLVKTEYKDRMEWHKGNKGAGDSGVTLAEIVLYKKRISTKGMKDSDKTESKTESKTENKKDSKKGE